MNRSRISVIILCFVSVYLIVLGKAFYIQVVGPDNLISYSKSQLLREYKIYPNRGNINDRNGQPLAINVQTFNIFTLPRDMQITQRSLRALSKIVPQINYNTVISHVKKRDRYTWIARKIRLNPVQIDKIRDLESIFLELESSRVYPNQELLGQVLGFVGVDNDGLGGIEYQYNEKLRGDVKVVKYLKDAKGRPLKRESMDFHSKSEDLVLSIDKNLQALSESILRETVIKDRAEKGGIGIMDAESGEILAIANYPGFDPNNPKNYNPDYRKLSFVTDPFEPGSIFKTLTIASALENKILNEDTHYYCEKGHLVVEDHVINEAETSEKFEWLSVSDILKFSSNIGTTKIAFDLKYPKLKTTLELFGVGKKTGIEIPGESRGIFTKKENISPLALSNVSFGQGVATTGIQMLEAYATIANHGIMRRPTLLKDGNKDQPGIRVISDATAKTLEKMLIGVVDSGTGQNAQVPFFKIAGKTGTAQKAIDGGYAGYMSSFVGFPVNVEKRFVVLVYIDNPKNGSYYGNDVAAPIFKAVVQSLLYKNKNIEPTMAKNSLPKQEIDTVTTTQAKSRFLGKFLVPNFVGLDRKSATDLSQQAEISIEHIGMGLVESQSIAAGQSVGPAQRINLNYKIPSYE